MKTLLTVFGLLICACLLAQPNNFQLPLSINSDGAAPHASAILDLQSTDKGILIPRITSTAAIASPVEGLLIYQMETPKGFYYFDGSQWNSFGIPSPFRLENLSTIERDLISPLPGMLIYNTDIGRPEYYRVADPDSIGSVINNDSTENGCTSIAQSFEPTSSKSITDIVAKIDFNGNLNDVILKIYDGEGIGSFPVYTEYLTFQNIPVQNGNEYQFILNTPFPITCCSVKTFEITQISNDNITAHLNFQDNVVYFPGTDPYPDPYPSGKFYKNGVNSDLIQGGPTVDLITSKDLHFTINIKTIGWVTQ